MTLEEKYQALVYMLDASKKYSIKKRMKVYRQLLFYLKINIDVDLKETLTGKMHKVVTDLVTGATFNVTD